jgi:hypothetical protein
VEVDVVDEDPSGEEGAADGEVCNFVLGVHGVGL